ncbi:unnamed protein product [Rotaria magnacalcarata]|uniref:Uncharacterized protein n=1 Tax=Rotaria magnacalcarata TaxID=392030 RepID=A0A815ALG9_9BILA|nr:unnamed protein product [Rotaria magnacalcarata]
MTKGNFDSYPSKHVKESNKQKKKVNFRVNRSSLPSTTIIQTNQENQELQHVAQDLLNTYCHRSCTSNFKSNKNSRAFKTNITSYSMTFDDPVEEHEFISHGKHRTKRLVVENNDNRLKKLRCDLNQLRSEFTDAVSKLVNHMDSHHEKVEKQLKMFSKTIQRATVASGLDQFRRDGEIFPDIVSFNNQNLLDTYDSGSLGQFARSILKKLFTAEMCGSILYPNDNYAKPGLDANRMKT